MPTKQTNDFYLCLAGMKKSFTSSTSDYIKNSYDFGFIDGRKESEFLLKTDACMTDLKGKFVDGTQSYLYQDNFKRFNFVNINKSILIIHNDIRKQYERVFNMHYQSSDNKFRLAEKFMKGDGVPKHVVESPFYERRKETLLEYREFVGREVTDGEIIHFFYKISDHFFFKEDTRKKIELIINGDINRFFQMEIKQLRTLDFENFCILPFVLVPWVKDWIDKNVARDVTSILTFTDVHQLTEKLDNFMESLGLPKTNTYEFPYVRPQSKHRNNKTVHLSDGAANILYKLEQTFKENMNVHY